MPKDVILSGLYTRLAAAQVDARCKMQDPQIDARTETDVHRRCLAPTLSMSSSSMWRAWHPLGKRDGKRVSSKSEAPRRNVAGPTQNSKLRTQNSSGGLWAANPKSEIRNPKFGRLGRDILARRSHWCIETNHSTPLTAETSNGPATDPQDTVETAVICSRRCAQHAHHRPEHTGS